MANVGAGLGKKNALYGRGLKLGIRKEDIIEKFIRSQGPGGQKVNKTSTCVYLKHIPTGIEVKCQKERSQALNRYLARRILVEKIEEQRLRGIAQQRQALEKLKRKQRKRSKSAKLRILEEKHRHAWKKKLRAKVLEID